MEGWIQLHRQLLASDTFQNEKMLKVFIYCLLKASHKEHKQKVGRQTVELKPGQFVFGRRKASIELNMNESTLRDYMYALRDDNTIDIKSANKFSVVSIVNWEVYQSKEENTDNKYDSKKTTKGQQKDTNNNGNNGNNGNKEKNKRSKLKFETHHMQLAELLFKKIKANNPNAKEPNLESWANTFRLMMESPKEKRSGKEIQDLILFTQNHYFWHKNILSADKLRKQFDRLTLEMKDQNKLIKPNNVVPIRADEQEDTRNYGF